MTDIYQPATHGSFVIERTYPQPRARVFSALSTAATVRRWYIESDRKDVHSFEMDFRVDGIERAEYTYIGGTPVDGVLFVNEGRYLDIVIHRRVVVASAMMAGGQTISVSLVTFELHDESNGGTRLVFTHNGAFFKGADGPQYRETGWRTLLDRLAADLKQ
jgi:uncharacterized protein YndB with AHSA1/START domain